MGFWNRKYIIDCYVKMLESAGARVVPVQYDWPESKYREYINKLNGLLLPGGENDLLGIEKNATVPTPSYFCKQGLILFNLIKEKNDNGTYFPLWGTCQGFQQLMVYEMDYPWLDKVDAENYPTVFNFGAIYKNSRMFGQITTDEYSKWNDKQIIMGYHHFGISVERYNSD